MADFRPHHYANELKLGGKHASDRSLVYQWNGVFWEVVPDKSGEARAYRWLVENDQANASPRNASAAHQASILWLDELPMAMESELFVPCQNGYVKCVGTDLELVKPSPELGLQFALACDYIPGYTRPLFEKFLNSVLPDKEVQARVQEYVGYTLTSDARYQKAQMWLGSGANGKGVLANVIQALHGAVAAVSLDELEGFRLSALIGASLIYCDEVPRARINEQMLKSMVAGERVLIDRKYRDPLSIHVRGKWLVLGNHLPTVTDHSVGFWRRWDIVPFVVTVPEAERDPLLAEKIIVGELSGVLNWALDGLMRLRQRGRFDSVMPAAMKAMLHEAKVETNSVQAWFEDADIAFSSNTDTVKEHAYHQYAEWCQRNGLSPMASIRFWTRVRDLGDFDESRIRHGARQVRCCNLKLAATTLDKAALTGGYKTPTPF